jgi:hypothetical protein
MPRKIGTKHRLLRSIFRDNPTVLELGYVAACEEHPILRTVSNSAYYSARLRVASERIAGAERMSSAKIVEELRKRLEAGEDVTLLKPKDLGCAGVRNWARMVAKAKRAVDIASSKDEMSRTELPELVDPIDALKKQAAFMRQLAEACGYKIEVSVIRTEVIPL